MAGESLVIWKYVLDSAQNEIVMPKGGLILHVEAQDDKLCLWVQVDPAKDAEMEERRFRILVTGQLFTPEWLEDGATYLGTVFLHGEGTVLHVFEWRDKKPTEGCFLTRYRQKPMIVEAEQFLPDVYGIPLPDGVRSVPTYNDEGNSHIIYFFDQTMRDSLFPQSQPISTGDFIVTNDRGERSVMQGVLFEALYEKETDTCEEIIRPQTIEEWQKEDRRARKWFRGTS